jgi:uncharacterized protein YdcH (DUF465 family)
MLDFCVDADVCDARETCAPNEPHPQQEVGTMVHNHDELRQELAQTNPEFRRLMDEHARFQTRLAELQGKAVLEDEERVETVNLKKQKLNVKDRMERILQEHIEKLSGSAVRH